MSRPRAEGVGVPAEGGRGEALVRQLHVVAAYDLENFFFFVQELAVPLGHHRPAKRALGEYDGIKMGKKSWHSRILCLQFVWLFLLATLNFIFKFLDFSLIVFLFLHGCTSDRSLLAK